MPTRAAARIAIPIRIRCAMKHFPKPPMTIADVLDRVERRARHTAKTSQEYQRWKDIAETADQMAREMAIRDGWSPPGTDPLYLLKSTKARKYWKRTASAIRALFGVDLDLIVVRMRVEEKAQQIDRLLGR